MTPTRPRTLSARVTDDLGADVDRVAALDGLDETSLVVRAALREYVDRRLGRRTFPLAEALEGPGTARRHDPDTSKAAAYTDAGRKGSQRRDVLTYIAQAGRLGMTTDEVIVRLEQRARAAGQRPPAVNGIARRVTDCLQAGFIAPAYSREELDAWQRDTAHKPAPLTRTTRHGKAAIVYTATPHGRRVLEDALEAERARAQEAA